MVTTTSAEKMRKLRKRRKEDGFNIQPHHKKERACKANI